MTQVELDRALCVATGESLREIRRRGFSLADPLSVAHDPEPFAGAPGVVDWDELDAQRVRFFPVSPRAQRPRLLAA